MSHFVLPTKIARWSVPATLGAAAFVVSLAACGDPTGPTRIDDSEVIHDVVVIGAVIDDAENRVVPNLPRNQQLDSLSVRLNMVSSAIAAGSASLAKSSLENAKTSLERYAEVMSGSTSAEAEIDVLRMSLAAISFEPSAAARK